MIKFENETKAVVDARKAAWATKKAEIEAAAVAKRIPREANGNKPVTHNDLIRVLDALRAHGIDI